MRPTLSVIIPVYNEVERLANIPKVSRFLTALPFSTELIVVDDGSTDQTLARLQRLKDKRIRLLHYQPNRGKGYALRQGMLSARGKWRLFMDVDLSVPLSTIPTLVERLQKHDIVLGTRKQRGSRVVRKQSRLREWLGKGFTALSRWSLGLAVTDFTCGFKAYRSDAAQALFSRSHIHRWGFDAELLFLAQKLGFSSAELPVSWKNDTRSKVRFPHDIFRSLGDLAAIRIHDWLGRYR